MVFDLFSMLNKIVVVVIPYPGQKVYKYIYSAIPKRPLIWQYTVHSNFRTTWALLQSHRHRWHARN